MRTMDITAEVLVIIGALNWGLVGLFDYNLVASLFGEESGLSRFIYALVGLAGLWVAGSVIPYLSHRGSTARA